MRKKIIFNNKFIDKKEYMSLIHVIFACSSSIKSIKTKNIKKRTKSISNQTIEICKPYKIFLILKKLF